MRTVPVRLIYVYESKNLLASICSKQTEIIYLKFLTILKEWASFFTILIGFELFPMFSNKGGTSLPSISSFRLRPRDPKTFLSSHMSTWKLCKFKQMKCKKYHNMSIHQRKLLNILHCNLGAISTGLCIHMVGRQRGYAQPVTHVQDFYLNRQKL